MKKLIAKTAVQTVLIAAGVLLAVALILNFGFPAHMATLFENTGNYALAAEYAATAYERSGDTDDLVRCVDDSILAHRNDYIVKYGKELIADENFSRVCQTKDAAADGLDYCQLVYGEVALAVYASGDFDGAYEIADDGRRVRGDACFSEGNALHVLCLKVVSCKDAAAAATLTGALESIEPTETGESALLESVIQELNNIQE